MTTLIAAASADYLYMQKAIELAKLGRFTTTPNPNVGCVITKDGHIVGEGYHQKAGQAHAEINALLQAGNNAKNATAYVTLEPCSHFGRTPPCANALIAAGIKRVVIAMQDPNPNVSGKGITILRNAGVEVEVGLCAQDAEQLNVAFFKRMRTGLPYVQLKLATSLDGKIAMASGESKWITSNIARQDVQQFRAQASAILSTRMTVQTDNASLTVRHSELPSAIQSIYPRDLVRQPIRIILDSQSRLTGNEKVFSQQGETWLIRKNREPVAHHPLIVESSDQMQVDLKAVLSTLAEKQINSIWVEAGAHLAGALIQQELIDELIIYYAPKILGDSAKDMCVIPELQNLTSAPKFQFKSVTMLGTDMRVILTKTVNPNFQSDTDFY